MVAASRRIPETIHSSLGFKVQGLKKYIKALGANNVLTESVDRVFLLEPHFASGTGWGGAGRGGAGRGGAGLGWAGAGLAETEIGLEELEKLCLDRKQNMFPGGQQQQQQAISFYFCLEGWG